MRQSALSGILGSKPQKYGQRHSDVYDAAAYSNAAEYDRSAEKANTDYQLRQQEAQRKLVLSGRGELAQEQQRQNDVANKRNSIVYGAAQNFLGGLFR
jgi:hypothetical protein